MEIPAENDISAFIIKIVEANMERAVPLGSIIFPLGESRLSRAEVNSLRTEIQNKKARKVVIHGACITVICR